MDEFFGAVVAIVGLAGFGFLIWFVWWFLKGVLFDKYDGPIE